MRQESRQGFTRTVTDPAVALSEGKTTVWYPSADMKGGTEWVAKVLGIPAGPVERSTGVSGATLIVGVDWRAGTECSVQDDDNVPESTDALNGSDTLACMEVKPDYT
ncbi:hypothetical protein ABZ678_26770 [Streptomyces hirsutus]|uniref:hypothetical protein n=1 Tax=Streptomyces hirsutus TaxID=35620 RepID=UPI0033F11217